MKEINSRTICITRKDIVEYLESKDVFLDYHGVNISPFNGGFSQMPDQVLVVVTISEEQEKT
jgi:hypothetical protein